MNIHDKFYVIEKMAKLIDHEKTGNSFDFSSSLGISRSQLFIDIDEFRSLGVEVSYDRSKRSFVFSGDKKIIVREPLLIVDNSELVTINGGFFQQKEFRSFLWTVLL